MRIHICHLSSFEGIGLLRDKPKNLSCGVTPHHSLLCLERDIKTKSWYKVNPPIRTRFDRRSLFEGIQRGFVDIIESDHAPHTVEEKNLEFSEIPSGLPGVETMFPLFLYLAKQGKLSFQRLFSLICEEPARLMDLNKGKIEVDKDADLIIVDLKEICKIKTKEIHYKCGWTPFEKWRAIFPTHLFIRGQKLIEDREMIGSEGFGRFVGE